MRTLKQIRKDQAAGNGMFSTKEEVDRAREREEAKKRTNITIRFSVNVLKKLKQEISETKEINKYGAEALVQKYIEKLRG